MAIGAAALILILSIYNGFNGIIEDNLSDLDPDALIVSAKGKYFIPDDEVFDALHSDPRIKSISSVLQEEVFISYGENQGLALAKGVDAVFEKDAQMAKYTIEGTFTLHRGDLPMAAAGMGLAENLGIHTHFLDKISLFYPRRGKRIPLLGPSSSLNSIKVSAGSLFSVNTTVDNELIILPIESMRQLIGSGDIVSGIELRWGDKADARYLDSLRSKLGTDYEVKDRFQQNPSLYKMMRYEKLAIYMILIFIVIIVSFNIFGSLSMLKIEKKEDMATLESMGAGRRLVKRIFVLEGWLVSLIGLSAGLIVGIALALLQQHFGIIKMPGGFLLQAYPVIIQVSDIIWTALGISAVGFVISLLARD